MPKRHAPAGSARMLATSAIHTLDACDRVMEEAMNDLLERAIAAHGGLERWKTLKRLTVTAVSGGGLFELKGMPQDPSPREQTVTLHEETASAFPFGQLDWRTRFTPHRVAIETTAGAVVRERSDPENLIRRTRHADALGPAASGLLQRVCDVDLSHHAVPHGDARLRSHRDRALAGRCGALARAARAISRRNRQSQQGAGLLLRRGLPPAPTRLSRRYRRRIPRRAIGR